MNQSLVEQEGHQDNLNVILVTIACGNSMRDKDNAWKDLVNSLVSVFDAVNGSSNREDFVLGFNVLSENGRVESSQYESVSEDVYKNLLNNF